MKSATMRSPGSARACSASNQMNLGAGSHVGSVYLAGQATCKAPERTACCMTQGSSHRSAFAMSPHKPSHSYAKEANTGMSSNLEIQSECAGPYMPHLKHSFLSGGEQLPPRIPHCGYVVGVGQMQAVSKGVRVSHHACLDG